MSNEVMRYLDYWVGIPLCFLFSGLNCVLSALRFGKESTKGISRKILFIKLSEIGAIILAYPLLRKARLDLPSAEIFFLTFEKNKGIFEGLDNIISPKNVLTIRESSVLAFIFDAFNTIRKIRKEKFGIVIDLEFFSRYTAILTYLSKADRKIGFYPYKFRRLYRGNFLTHRIPYNPLLHISKMYLAMWQPIKNEDNHTLELAGKITDSDIILPKFTSAIAAKKEIENRLRGFGISKENRLFLLAPGEGVLPLREWPIENFIALSKLILEGDLRNYLILIGTKEGARKAELLQKGLGSERCINLIGKTNVPELLEFFNISHALIANDCGLAHLASLTPIRKFIIFGPESPKVFGPLGENNCIIYMNLPCSPCFSILNNRQSVCQDNKCLKLIRHEDVYDLVRKYL